MAGSKRFSIDFLAVNKELDKDRLQQTAPIHWSLDTKIGGKALLVEDRHIYVGLNDGRLIRTSSEGVVESVYLLPGQVGNVARDGNWLYAWCHGESPIQPWKGALYTYDLSSSVPKLVYEIMDVGEQLIHGVLVDGLLAVGDANGSVGVLGCDGEAIWYKEQVERSSNLFCADKSGIYVGHKRRVSKFSWKDGEVLWTHQSVGRQNVVRNGEQDTEHLYVEIGTKVVQLRKSDGSVVREFQPNRHRADGVVIGSGMLLTGSCPTVLFDLKTGEEKFRMNYSGRFADSKAHMKENGHMIVLWDKLYCVDLSEEGIQRAVDGRSSRTIEHHVDQPGKEVSMAVDDTTDPSGGALVQCVRESVDGPLIVMPCADTYDESWRVCLPVYAVRQPGMHYLVDKLVPSEAGQFYRAYGSVKRLVTNVASNVNNNQEEPVTNVTDDTENQTQVVTTEEENVTPMPSKSPEHDMNISTGDQDISMVNISQSDTPGKNTEQKSGAVSEQSGNIDENATNTEKDIDGDLESSQTKEDTTQNVN